MKLILIFGLGCTASTSLVLISLSATLAQAQQAPIHAQQIQAQQVQAQQTSAQQTQSPPLADEYVFDPMLFRGSNLNKETLVQLSKGSNLVAGTYKVDLYVNNRFIERGNIRFIEQNQLIVPCLSMDLIQRAAIITLRTDTPNQQEQCDVLESFVEAGSSQLDINRLRLDLSIPHSMLKHLPEGYIHHREWDAGDSIGFINYMSHYYHNVFKFGDQKLQSDAAYLSINGGVNINQWQFRQQSSLTYQQDKFSWNSIRSYLKRPIASIQSEMSFGQLTSKGRFFSGLNFNGINLSSDERMLAPSQRGYAPVIQGIAKSNARVSVQQFGREIYQLSVAPGPFRINDLYPTNANGDLNVIIYEADGSSAEFRVPFSAAPESIRQGAFKYNLDIGRTRDQAEHMDFASLTTQYGINNAITINNGLRFAPNYQAAMLGSAYTNRWGAVAADLTYSRSALAQQGFSDGWMLSSSYSKTFSPSQTSIALSGYRFSTKGYRELTDFIGLVQANKAGMPFQSNTHQERSRLTLSINQPLGNYGNVYLSGSAQNYRDNKPNDYQLQFGYSKAWINGISLNISLSKIQRGQHAIASSANAANALDAGSSNASASDTNFGLTVNIPFSAKAFRPKSLSFGYSNNAQRNSYQANINGTLDAQSSLQYSLGLNYDDQTTQRNWHGSLQKRMPYANVDVSGSIGQSYWQSSVNLQGALALHSGGVTFGSYLSDTFALVEAKGAKGAQVLNAQGVRIDRRGYALVPSLTPYQNNAITLNPEGIQGQAELESGHHSIVPYAGAAIRVKFKTRQGFAMLIRSEISPTKALPLGAEVLDEHGASVGIVGQNGQIYLRTQQQHGSLKVRWGNSPTDGCVIHYQVADLALKQHLIKFSSPCQPE
ncbi:outer membrane usher protein [Acinetobacter calcoaceticus]|uniref:Outer membrane usher protein n=1 Tax=Acinetobacter calcoaceticus TaxID=471 RepID=A0A4R1X959_ACICA|nr:outer membrane usher protein [Acinetobacter calcoaceticus]